MLSLNFLVLPLTHPLSRDSKGSQAGIELNMHFTFSERYMVSEQLALDQFLLKNTNVCQMILHGYTFSLFFFSDNTGILRANCIGKTDTSTFSLETK